jgi:hypothetical protein
MLYLQAVVELIREADMLGSLRHPWYDLLFSDTYMTTSILYVVEPVLGCALLSLYKVLAHRVHDNVV